MNGVLVSAVVDTNSSKNNNFSTKSLGIDKMTARPEIISSKDVNIAEFRGTMNVGACENRRNSGQRLCVCCAATSKHVPGYWFFCTKMG